MRLSFLMCKNSPFLLQRQQDGIYMIKLGNFAFVLMAFSLQMAEAHSHHTTYIVEENCHHHHCHHPEVVVVQPVQPVQYVMVDSAPPDDFYEEAGPCPGSNFVWVKGRWGWDGYRYVRVPGQWAARPNTAAVWVPGHWSEHHGKWRWHEGYWN